MLTRFCSLAWLYHKGRTAAFSLPEFLCLDAGYPILTLIFYCLLAGYSFQTNDVTRWVIGNSFLLCTNACLFGLGGVLNAERATGRLRSIVAAPCAKLPLILAGGVFPAGMALLAVAGGLLVGGALFRVNYAGVALPVMAVILLCAMAAAAELGLLLAVLSLLTDGMHMLLNVVYYLLLLCTGAQFPVSQLPAAGRLLARLLPLTRSIYAMERLLQGQTQGVWPLLGGELGVAAGYALLAWAVFRLAERQCRRNGTLDLF